MKMMMITAICLMFFISSYSQDTTGTEGTDVQATSNEDNFVMEAAMDGMKEVELGNIAKDKAESQEVKNFAERMVKDHSKANDELKSIALSQDIALPDSIMAEHREMIDELANLSGSEFDTKFMDMMVEDHEKAVEMFKDASENHENTEIKYWASEYLPILQEHLDLAKSIRDGMGTGQSDTDTE